MPIRVQQMLRRIAVGAILSWLTLAVVACAGLTSTPAPAPTPASIPSSTPTQARLSAPGGFEVAQLGIDPAEVNPGQEIRITAQVTNTGDEEESYTAELSINNIAEAVREEVLPAGGTQTLSFLVSKDIPGTYEVALGGLAGQFVVVKPAELTPTSNGKAVSPELTVAPDFTGIDVVTNETVSLGQFRGSVVLINFVNYGCSRSLSQIVSAQLLVIRDVAKERDDFVPLSIFCGCCPRDVLRDFTEQNGLTWPWIRGTANSTVPQYVGYLIEYGYPTLVFIDKHQYVREVTGYCDFFTLSAKIDETSQY